MGRAAAPSFPALVLKPGIVVRAVVGNGLADALGRLVPDGTGLPARLRIAAPAALPANLIDNLPAVPVRQPPTAPPGPCAVLAVLLGVDTRPDLTYAGSPARLLWRRIVHQHSHGVDLRELTLLGAIAVPAAPAPGETRRRSLCSR
ncbi:hypothetical protein GCM10010448_07300 [Streptomyces glomeratus]|uniref:Uncharacterized protein n=1 Tax=Streptomyces glomeratus TaxID=284452 RepID=A0ABP6KZD7_9ACTN